MLNIYIIYWMRNLDRQMQGNGLDKCRRGTANGLFFNICMKQPKFIN